MGSAVMLTPSVLLLWYLGAATSANGDVPLFVGSTPKSVHEFVSCFLLNEDSQSRAVWFVPHEDGGRISNRGAPAVSNPYRIRFTEGARGNQLRVFLSRPDRAEERHLLDAIENCS